MPIKVHRARPANNAYWPKNHYPLRVWCGLYFGIPEEKIKAAVEKVAEEFATELRAAGFPEVLVRQTHIVAGWLIKYECTILVRYVPVKNDVGWAFISNDDLAKIKAMTYVSKRKADKGKGPGIVEMEVG